MGKMDLLDQASNDDIRHPYLDIIHSKCSKHSLWNSIVNLFFAFSFFFAFDIEIFLFQKKRKNNHK